MIEAAPRVIPLGRDAIDNPTRLHLALIEGFMIWPGNETARDNAIKAAAVEYAAPHVRDMEPEHIDAFAEIAMGAFPLAHMQESAKTSFQRGAIAGMVLRECVGRLSLGQEVKLAAVFDSVSRGGISKKVFDNEAWPNFRPVAHFWASWIDLYAGGGLAPFPCTVCDLRAFLETAEAYRSLAEASRTKQSPKPILAPGEAFRLPPELDINPRPISFESKKTFPF